MAINGISSYGMSSYFDYQATVSRVRLQQALSRNPKIQSAVEPVDPISSSYKGSSMDFLKDYSSTMSDVMQSANSLREVNRSGVMNELSVSSSDKSVAVVTERYAQRAAKDLSLDVTQLAAAQKSVSDGVKGSAAAAEGMDFVLESASGSFDSVRIQVAAQNDDGSSKTNRQMLKEAARQVNASDAGILATVVEKDGQSVLELKGRSTGTASAFRITGQSGPASGIETAVTDAQNAEYTVTSGSTTKAYSSQSNKIQLDYGKIEADLKGTGSAVISSKVDDQKIISAVSDLVTSYNKALTFLNGNAEHGTGVIRQISSFSRDLSADKSLKMAGITTNKDGTLSLDKDALKDSLTKNPALTKSLLSGSSSISQTAFNRASSAMSANSASLISNDLAQISQSAYTDPINFMNLYSRNGRLAGNYNAVGLLMNYMV